jgi:hypothetical protein
MGFDKIRQADENFAHKKSVNKQCPTSNIDAAPR